MVIQSVRSNVGGICNLVLFMGLFAISVSPVGAIPINTSGGGASIKYPINIACECIFTLYVDGVYVGEGNKENYDPVNWPFGISEWNNTKKYYPVIYENEPKIVAFNGIGGQYTVFPNGFIMDMNDGKDYTKYKEWKCKDFSKTTEKTPPANWFTYDYDDSGWDISTSYGANYQNNSFQIFESPRDFISLNAEWLWTKDNADANIYCRKKNMDTVVLTSAPMVTTTIVPPPVTTIATMVTSAPVVTSVPVVKTTVAPLVTSVPVVKTTVAPLVTSVPVVKTTVAHTPVSTTIHPPVTTTVTHLPVTTTVTPLLTSVPVIKTTIVPPPVTTIIAHPPVTTTITHPPVTTSAPVSTTIHHHVRTHPPVTTTITHPPVTTAVTSVPVIKTTVAHPLVTTTITPLVVPPSVPPPIHPSPPINIKIVINNIKYSQGVSDKQLAHLLENIKFYNHPQYQSKYRNDHLDNNNLYRTVLNARLDLIRHYEVLLRHFERIERLKHESRDEDTDYKIPRHSSDDSTSKSNIIQSMIKLNSRIKHIEDSIHFIKGNHKYLLLHILKTLKQQYKKDTMKIFNI